RYVQDQYSFFNLFDGGVFSCDIHMLKPSPEIYRYFLDQYRLDPHDCLFFDDMEENIKAAENFGIKGILFTGEQKVKDFI
ncbi:MAG TPA: HAD-IA family hydrolase, partial [Clostridia bacterium]|nr:HAD-IA family hydrolase [Clostridia bacterium]